MQRFLLVGIGLAVASGALVAGCRTNGGATSLLRKANTPAAADIRPELLAAEEKPHPSAAADEIAGSPSAAAESEADLQARLAEVMERERRLAQEEMKAGAKIWSKPAEVPTSPQPNADMQAMAAEAAAPASGKDANRPVCVDRIDEGRAGAAHVPAWTEEESGEPVAPAAGAALPHIAETPSAASPLPAVSEGGEELAAEAIEVPGMMTPQHA
ncbi:MAG: hypothetical protein N3A66_09575, partial [Planctomycetota bacterium]|nr:hypothetical protein [Planctomycetota bacterium]